MSEEAIPDGASAAPGGAPVAAAAALNSITQYEYSSEDWYTILLAIEVWREKVYPELVKLDFTEEAVLEQENEQAGDESQPANEVSK